MCQFKCILCVLELNYSRYKIIAQVLIGEQRGEGVRMATRCLWDAEADNYATQTFMSVWFFLILYKLFYIVTYFIFSLN